MRNKALLVAFAVSAAVLVGVYGYAARLALSLGTSARAWVYLPDGFSVLADVMDTPETRAHGLSNTRSLGAQAGMLFLFRSTDRYPFWMKDMRYPIDIVWLDHGQVVDVWADAPAPTFGQPPAEHVPKAPADAVLEINAGQAGVHKIEVGSRLDIRLPSGYTGPAN